MFSIKVSYKMSSGETMTLDYGVCSAVLLQTVCKSLTSDYGDESEFCIILTPYSAKS